MTGYLSSVEQAALYDLLCKSSVSVQQLEQEFRSAFPPDAYSRVTEELQFLRREAGYLVAATTTHSETFVSFVLLGIMRRECHAAKTAFFDFAYALELQLREDARKAEQAKYRSTTKDAPQKKPVRDVMDAEALRFRCATKLLVLNGLLDKQDGNATASSAFSVDQQTLDNALQQISQSSGDAKEKLADLAHLSEKESSKCHSLVHGAAVVVGHDQHRSVVVPILARPVLPSVAPVIPGELKYVLLAPSGLPQQLLFDGHGASADWKTARSILAAAAKAPLSPSDEEALTAILASERGVINRMLISPQVVCAIATHNPQVCASVITHRPDLSAQLVSAIILSPEIPVECVETILLHTGRILEQFHVFKYIQLSIARIRATESGDSQREVAKRFAMTLHHLVTKASRENKELYIADCHKSDLSTLFGEYPTVAEIATRWAEMS